MPGTGVTPTRLGVSDPFSISASMRRRLRSSRSGSDLRNSISCRRYPVREWQKLRERNEALDCYVYARAAAAAAGLDRFEERHWRELERSLGIEETPKASAPLIATEAGLQGASESPRVRTRRTVKSRWMA